MEKTSKQVPMLDKCIQAQEKEEKEYRALQKEVKLINTPKGWETFHFFQLKKNQGLQNK